MNEMNRSPIAVVRFAHIPSEGWGNGGQNAADHAVGWIDVMSGVWRRAEIGPHGSAAPQEQEVDRSEYSDYGDVRDQPCQEMIPEEQDVRGYDGGDHEHEIDDHVRVLGHPEAPPSTSSFSTADTHRIPGGRSMRRRNQISRNS
jgi:hypothetical protein